jgi:hypothetical protein
MALRGPQRPGASPLKPVDTKAPGAKLSTVEQALIKAGVAKTPQEAKKLAQTLLSALRGKGVPANTLPLAIKQFQKQAGLKETGQLDNKTLQALQQQGLLPAGDKAKGPAPKKAGPGAQVPGKADVVVKGPARPAKVTGQPATAAVPAGTHGRVTGEAHHHVNIEQAVARSELAQGQETFGPRELLENLATLGFFAGGKGADQLRNALKSFQASMGLPTSGKLDPETAQKLVEQGALPESAAERLAAEGRDGKATTGGQGGAEGAGAQTKARGEASAADAREQARSDADAANQDAFMRGVAEGERDAAAGRGAEGEGKARKKGKGGHGDAAEGEGAGGVDEGDDDGAEVDDGNAPAGDDDLDDADRGHAQLKREDADVGHYAIAPLSEQLKEALEQIERDDDGRGPVTYCWDVTFYKPGVYGPYQPAEPLWHIGVEKVTAFDEVWRNAAEALASRMGKMEPDVAPPSFLDFERALRRARARSTP